MILLDIETFFDTVSDKKNKYSLRSMNVVEYTLDDRRELICTALYNTEEKEKGIQFFWGEDLLAYLEEWLPCTMIAHNARFDFYFLSKLFPDLPWGKCKFMCTMLMAQGFLHSANKQGILSLDQLAETYLGTGKTIDLADLYDGKSLEAIMSQGLSTQLKKYAKHDLKMTIDLFKIFRNKISKTQLGVIKWALHVFIRPMVDVDQLTTLKLSVGLREKRMQFLYSLKVDQEVLSSRTKWVDLVESRGHKLEYKPSPSNPTKFIPQTAKTDPFIMQNQHRKDDLGELIRGRLAFSSNLELSRCEKWLSLYELSPNYHYSVTPSGTFTHRLTGNASGNVNPLNLPRKSELRKAIKPKNPKHIFCGFDLTGLELRIARFVANDLPAIKLINKGDDLYIDFITNAMGLNKAQFIKDYKAGDEQCDQLRFIGKQCVLACIAEGTDVLTEHRGWVPIEKVSTDDRVWDGIEWVSHDGPIYQGEKVCIEHDGIVATPDHRVYLEDGSIRNLEDAKQTITQSATKEGHPIRTTESGGRLGVYKRLLESRLSMHTLRGLFTIGKLQQVKLRKRQVNPVQTLCQKIVSTGTYVFRKKIHRSKTAMRKLQRSELSSVWGQGYQVPFSFGTCSSYMGCEESQTRRHAICGDRPQGQQQTLQQGQHKVHNKNSQHKEQAQFNTFHTQTKKDTLSTRTACGSILMAGCKLFRKVLSLPIFKKGVPDASGYSGSLPHSSFMQTQRTWDLLNAGPKHRFTICSSKGVGKLVHNCQYGTSGRKLNIMLRNFGIDIGEEKCSDLVSYFRKKGHVALPNIWQAFETMLMQQVDPAKPMYNAQEIRNVINMPGNPLAGGGWVWPSGTALKFTKLRREAALGMSVNYVYKPGYPVSRANKAIYPSAYFQAHIQSLANEVISDIRKRLIGAGYYVAMECYDELTMVIPRSKMNEETRQEVQAIAEAPMEWWPEGPPLEAEVKFGETYYDLK